MGVLTRPRVNSRRTLDKRGEGRGAKRWGLTKEVELRYASSGVPGPMYQSRPRILPSRYLPIHPVPNHCSLRGLLEPLHTKVVAALHSSPPSAPLAPSARILPLHGVQGFHRSLVPASSPIQPRDISLEVEQVAARQPVRRYAATFKYRLLGCMSPDHPTLIHLQTVDGGATVLW